MPTLSTLNFSQIVANSAAAIQSAASALVDFTAGSVLLSICEAAAGVGLWLQNQNYTTLQATRLATSSGPDVDSFGADFSFTRLPPNYATGDVTFRRYSPGNSTALVPVGAVVLTSDGTQSYTVTEDASNSLWSSSLNGYLMPINTATVTVPVIAVNSGSQGNIVAGAISLISSSMPGIDAATNATAFTNGVDAETDAAFKLRFNNYIDTRSLCTELAIENAIANIQQGLTYTIQENVSSTGSYQPGNFVVTVDDGSGDPSTTLLNTVSTAVNNTRGLGITYSVLAPTVVTANVSMTITAQTGYIKANLQGPVATAIESYINALGVGVPLPYSILAKLAYDAAPGIANVTNILLNSGTSDVGGGLSQSVHPGSVAIN